MKRRSQRALSSYRIFLVEGTSRGSRPSRRESSMARSRGYIEVDSEACTGCEICVVLCPTQCLELGPETNSHGYRGAILAREEDCTGCEICGHICPHWAIDVFGEVF